jgi:6-pyruvoyltetrahydropterin 2'-reductase
MSIRTDKLKISQDFFSLQGEGKTMGYPSYFVRLAICNLSCGMSRKFLNQLVKDNTLKEGEIFTGDLHAEGKATWTCDSTSEWALKGEDKDFQYLINQWKEQGIYEQIRNGTIHIIWTGGEPTIKGHQEAISNFFKYWDQVDPIRPGTYGKAPFSEIETNGTIVIDRPLFRLLDQINCSPKLSNSGMTEKQRIVPTAINTIMSHINYQFKFVISTEDDVKEIFRDFIEPFNIPLDKICCMPGLDDRDNFHERTHFVFEMAKKYKFIASTRLHISAYGAVTGV